MEGNYVRFYRDIMDWEWYKNLNTFKLWFHCIVKANWQDGKFQGIEVPRGSFVSSYSKLAEETGLTYEEVRTATKNLIKSKNLTFTRFSKFGLFTVVSYDKYQSLPNHFPIYSQSIPNNRKKKEEKEINKYIYSERADLNEAILEFIAFRKETKAPMTKKAIDLMLAKLNKLTADEDEQIQILHQSIERGWKGVFPLDKGTKAPAPKKNRFSDIDQRNTDYDALLFGGGR